MLENVICCHHKALFPLLWTHWGWDKMAAILQTIFLKCFSMTIVVTLFQFTSHWNRPPKVHLKIKTCICLDNGLALKRRQAIIGIKDGRLYWFICVTRPQWVYAIVMVIIYIIVIAIAIFLMIFLYSCTQITLCVYFNRHIANDYTDTYSTQALCCSHWSWPMMANLTQWTWLPVSALPAPHRPWSRDWPKPKSKPR